MAQQAVAQIKVQRVGIGQDQVFSTAWRKGYGVRRVEIRREKLGRDRLPFTVHCRMPPSVTAEQVRALRDAGAHSINVIFREAMDEAAYLREMERIAKDVIQKL